MLLPLVMVLFQFDYSLLSSKCLLKTVKEEMLKRHNSVASAF